jgi:mutator protein MutT
LSPALRRQRVAVYGIAEDRDDHVLLTRAARSLTVAGQWFLPGGGIDHGETPEEALGRELAEETGLQGTVGALLGVLSDTIELPDGSILHSVRIVYALHDLTGTLRSETAGSTDDARWVPISQALAMPLLPYVRIALTSLRRPEG